MKRRSFTIFAVLLGALGVTAAPAVTGSPAGDAAVVPAAEFGQLLQQLSSPSFIQRDWAARRLLQHGPQISAPLVATVRDTDDDLIAAAAINLLAHASCNADPGFAASALLGMTSLQTDADKLPEVTRQLLASSYQAAVRHNLAQLTAAGAEIDRDDDRQVHRISIHTDRFTDRHLPLVGALTTIRILDLRGTPITGEGLRHLAALTSLERLVLTDTQVRGTSLRQLPTLPGLRDIALYRVPLTADDLNWLRDHLPRCQVNR
ncbi:MAG: hypothetical protein AB7U20_09390 [Planctomycetaceae bacterium]